MPIANCCCWKTAVSRTTYGGANWYPAEQRIAFESLINIRPRLGNRGILIQDETIRQQVEVISRALLGGHHAQ
ncbi:MAG: DUF5674 family protein [Candidatus Latescibacterota bacterium]